MINLCARISGVMSSLFAAITLAAVPGSMDYQGYLSDSTGAAISADTSITFSIYSAETGGAPLWSDTLLVPIDNGLFSVTLGTPVNPFPPGLFDTPLYLGIDVDGDGEMVPRRPLTTAAFSFKAEDADTLQGNSAADLNQSAAVTALQANSVLQLDTVLTLGGGGEAQIVASGGLAAANSAAGPDLIVGGLDGSGTGDDGVIASAPSLPGSDLLLQTNDALVIQLDADGNGEDADFVITDKDNLEIFNIEEDGQVRLHGPTSMGASDDPTFGPILTFLGETNDQVESGRLRFRESSTPTNLRGGYIHYDGSANAMHIGVHDASDDNLANDEDIITIERASGQVGIGTVSPNRELTVNDTDGNGDAVINVTAPGRELFVGVNQSSGAIVGTLTDNDLQFRTNSTTRMVVQSDGIVEATFDGQGFARATPLAYGKVRADGTLLHGTPNVQSTELDCFVWCKYKIDLTGGLSSSVTMQITVDVDDGSELDGTPPDVRIPVADNDAGLLRVTIIDSLGAVKSDTNFYFTFWQQ